MQKKVCIVSGVTGNLGKAVATEFLKQNYITIGLKRNASSEKTGLIPKLLDCTREENADLLVKELAAEYGTLDVAVLCVGGFAMGNLQKTGIKEMQKMLQLNFETAYNLARPLFLQMKAQGHGKLFFIGSSAARPLKNGKRMVAYALSKAMLFNLAEIINAEAGNAHIRAYVVQPGTIDTPQNREAMPAADRSNWQQPSEIAKLILKAAGSMSSQDGEFIIHVEKELNRS